MSNVCCVFHFFLQTFAFYILFGTKLRKKMSIRVVVKEYVCRFCLGDVNKYVKKKFRENVVIELNSLFNLEIYEEDDWPKDICDECKENSEHCLAFFRKIKETEEKFLEIFGEKFKDIEEEVYDQDGNLIEEIEVMKEEIIEEDVEYLEEEEVTELETVDEIKYMEEEEVTYTKPWKEALSEEEDEDEDVSVKEVKLSSSSTQQSKKQGRWRKDGSKKMRILKENNEVVRKFLGFKCDLCSEEAKNYYALKFHFRETHDMPGYLLCCDTKFTSLGRLAGHVKIHLDPEAFKCPRCFKILSNEVTFRVHARECSKNPSLTYTSVCGICSEAFPTSRMLRQHQKKHLSEEEKPHPCPDCSKRYTTPAEMNHHWSQVHKTERNYPCDVCGKGFRTPSQANAHKKNTHLRRKGPKVQCNRCGGFYPELNMYSHHQRCQVEPVQCTLCGKECCNPPALKNHIKYEHEGVERKKYACDECSKVFSTKRKVTDHKAKHRAIALHKCTWCEKKFFTLSTKTAHQRAHHPVENARAKIRK